MQLHSALKVCNPFLVLMFDITNFIKVKVPFYIDDYSGGSRDQIFLDFMQLFGKIK